MIKNMSRNPEWLKEMAEKEDGAIISVGGLANEIRRAEGQLREPTIGELWEMLEGEIREVAANPLDPRIMGILGLCSHINAAYRDKIHLLQERVARLQYEAGKPVDKEEDNGD